MTATASPTAIDPTEQARPPVASGSALRRRFDEVRAGTVGLEEEVILTEPRTMRPVPAADALVAAAADPRITRELPASQVELVTQPHLDPIDAVVELAQARALLVELCGGDLRPMAAAVHPTAPALSAVGASARHRQLALDYGDVARRQLVGALQVHVAVGSADATLAVYNALRGHLPELAALAAAAPFHEARDTGLASVRPLIAGQLPRQGVPPAIESWARHAEDLRWGVESGTVAEPGRWWWELRPHVVHGTLEVRVPDAQPTVGCVEGVVSLVHALVAHLASRHADGEALAVPVTWRIAENRWRALRDGVHGSLADLATGEERPTRAVLLDLIDAVEPSAPSGLDAARRLVASPAADRIRAVGIGRACSWLADAFEP